ncbi:hypothetical protein CEXT_733021 [Caerostris extrusa]|uniref:Uncharacterized protein n=1 Tax=Caerostris extrusa TaxID=172846 RepID=A0AAV4R1L9_CAEEX|nr:hypothetical protein CEXT_733021 [Caerostris extrusa]
MRPDQKIVAIISKLLNTSINLKMVRIMRIDVMVRNVYKNQRDSTHPHPGGRPSSEFKRSSAAAVSSYKSSSPYILIGRHGVI